MRTRPTARTIAVAMSVTSFLAACGDDTTSSTSDPTTTTAPAAGTSVPPTTVAPPPTTEVPDTGGDAVSDEDLAAAKDVAIAFVTALGEGDIATARSLIGAESEERTGSADVLESMLRASTEGHGAWRSATDRVVTPVAIASGLVAVELEGTLQVEGATEHRVEVFPVRQAEPAGAWSIEPWAWDFLGDPPFEIRSPAVDEQERAPATDNLVVEVTSHDAGTIHVSFDGRPADALEATAGQTLSFTPEDDRAHDVVVVFSAGATVAARGFVVESDSSPQESTRQE